MSPASAGVPTPDGTKLMTVRTIGTVGSDFGVSTNTWSRYQQNILSASAERELVAVFVELTEKTDALLVLASEIDLNEAGFSIVAPSGRSIE